MLRAVGRKTEGMNVAVNPSVGTLDRVAVFKEMKPT